MKSNFQNKIINNCYIQNKNVMILHIKQDVNHYIQFQNAQLLKEGWRQKDVEKKSNANNKR